MLSFIKEEFSSWELLKCAKKPLVLYGMGNGADRILARCQEEGIAVAGVFASDEFVRGQSFWGFPVLTYNEALTRWGDFIVLIAFASEDPVILARFFALAARHETYAPHVPLFPGEEVVSFAWLKRQEKQIQAAYDLWEDEPSRQVMADALNYKLSGKLSYLTRTTERKADLQEIFTFHQQEVYADLGAYNGDTLKEFLGLVEGRYEHIYALEPDKKNFAKLKSYVENEQLRKITLVEKGAWSHKDTLEFCQRGGRMSALGKEGKAQVEVTSIDEVLQGKPLTFVKMDVEGVEKETLLGGAQALRQYGPKLLVAAYHHDEDLWRLPLLLRELNPDYKLYLRRHPYVPCWELNIFAKLEEQ